MKKTGLVLLPIIAIALQILPSGATLIFAPSPTVTAKETYSYFSLAPLRYANFAPFITALLTCVVLLLALITIKRNNVSKAVFIVSLIATIISLFPLIHGIDYYSVVGGMITVMLTAESVLARLTMK
jgi:hypothetical protein